MATVKYFEDLEIWKLARETCKDIYRITKYELFRKDYSLVDQIRRSSVSIMDNIAEGFERDGRNELRQFLSISKGSCGECRSQLTRALDQKYISEAEFFEIKNKLIEESIKIKSFMNYLKKSTFKGNKYK